MIHILRQIIISVTVAAIFSGVMLSFVKDGALRETIRLATGMLMILALLSPMTAFRLPNVRDAFAKNTVEYSTKKAVKDNEALEASTVGGAISKYMQDQAKSLGIRCSILTQVSKDNQNRLVIDSICINYDKGSVEGDALEKLSKKIVEECGIPKEKQIFKGR